MISRLYIHSIKSLGHKLQCGGCIIDWYDAFEGARGNGPGKLKESVLNCAGKIEKKRDHPQ